MLILDMQKAQKKVTPQKTAPAYNDGKVVGILPGGMTQIVTTTGKLRIAKGTTGTQTIGNNVNIMGGLISAVPGRVLNEIEWRDV